ncbi:HEAT repeat domain-containing protein [Acinetobacter sp. NIPH 2699]|uniref:HEAT repeat domain-containing protein n=1 Tax=Acinetobacter sp. NIPH 2699 TaxID=2923433 RepID=UPI001F4A79D0|nr:HEAT repeat domain-containing protein [Acinetobacter sp. NIPH 2699]MCH7336109.1 HEAT repeat domain-containing protein [Acinetobacter sp. NIPH 2699]
MTINYPTFADLDEDYADYVLQLNQEDENIRFVAIMNIADEEQAELLAWLHHALLHDPASKVRELAATRLEGWEDAITLNTLAQALTDQHENVRLAAAQSLSEIKHAESAHHLAPYLQHQNDFVIASILRAIKELRAESLFDDIVHHVQHANALVRKEAVSTLSWLQKQQGLSTLAKIAQYDSDAEIRRIATGGLGASQSLNPEILSALESSLLAKEWQLRVEAALTIGKLKAVELEQTLLQQLDDVYWQVRIAVARSLGLLKSKAAVNKLTENFQHDISNLRKEVAIALGEIGGEQAQAILLQHAEDPDPEVRKSIRIGLALIQEKLNAA